MLFLSSSRITASLTYWVSLQLGAGTSLPGLVAAKVGADVTLTDESNRLEVLPLQSKFVVLGFS